MSRVSLSLSRKSLLFLLLVGVVSFIYLYSRIVVDHDPLPLVEQDTEAEGSLFHSEQVPSETIISAYENAEEPDFQKEPDFQEEPEPLPITNNYMEYPRLSPIPLDALDTLRQEHVQRIEEIIKDPLPKFSEWNVEQLKGLVHYWNTEVGQNGNLQQPKVILSSYGYVPCAMSLCSTTGEVIWLESLMTVFRNHNYFLLYDEYENIGKAYKRYGDVVTHIWSIDSHVIWCFNDTVNCIESPENPHGIPPWKLFAFTFWGSPIGWQNFMAPHEPWSYNPLGGEWNLVPYQMPDNQFYLGYHLRECEELPNIPSSERKDQVLILGKLSVYFHLYNLVDYSWWPRIVEGLRAAGIELISLADDDEKYPIPEALHTIGPQDRETYNTLLSTSKALLGVGRPELSPSPYASLCHALPVILPYRSKNCSPHPNSTEWCGFTGNNHQHGAFAGTFREPHLYMVAVEESVDEMIATIQRAVSTPIEPFVSPQMTLEQVTRRVDEYFLIDWKDFAAQRMQERGWNRVDTQQFMYKWLEQYPMIPQIP